jgi:hypothetical protein
MVHFWMRLLLERKHWDEISKALAGIFDNNGLKNDELCYEHETVDTQALVVSITTGLCHQRHSIIY